MMLFILMMYGQLEQMVCYLPNTFWTELYIAEFDH